MADEPSGSSPQFTNGLTYAVVRDLVHGRCAHEHAALPCGTFGDWEPIVRDLFSTFAAHGHAGVVRRYLHIVYDNPEFALFMASLGLQTPDRQWQPGELPSYPASASPADSTGNSAHGPPPDTHSARYTSRSVSRKDSRSASLPPKRKAARQDEVLTALQQLGPTTAPRIAQYTGQDRGNLHRRLQRLCETGLVERQDTPEGIVYRTRP